MMNDHSLGAIAGALVGDAGGSTLEFCYRKITEAMAKKAMGMPGGGSLNVGPGQITDDGELTLALASALVNECSYKEDKVAKAYSSWHKSNPFDMGQTTGRAFGFAESAKEMRANALKYNTLSEANGQLMRCSPIPAFLHEKTYVEIAEAARSDALLSHPSKACQDCVALYAVAIAYLINHAHQNPSKRVKGAIELVERLQEVDQKVAGWLENSKKPLQDVTDCAVNIGHVKHAFSLAFHFLRRTATYEEAIRETLKLGGDTDTNACIVGGMMGALHGFSSIPSYMADPVFEFDPVTYDVQKTQLGHRRPALYRPANILALLKADGGRIK